MMKTLSRVYYAHKHKHVSKVKWNANNAHCLYISRAEEMSSKNLRMFQKKKKKHVASSCSTRLCEATHKQHSGTRKKEKSESQADNACETH